MQKRSAVQFSFDWCTRRLGLLRIFFLLCIFGYIAGYVLFWQKRYYAMDVPVGGVQLSLKRPDGYVYPWNYTYCKQYVNRTANKADIADPLVCAGTQKRYQNIHTVCGNEIWVQFAEYGDPYTHNEAPRRLFKLNFDCRTGTSNFSPPIRARI